MKCELRAYDRSGEKHFLVFDTKKFITTFVAGERKLKRHDLVNSALREAIIAASGGGKDICGKEFDSGVMEL